VFRQLVALGLFPSIILTIAGQELFSVVFGSNWAEAGVYAQILSPWVFVLAISSPLSTLFAVLERQELALILNVIILATRIAALVIGGVLANVYVALALWSGTGIVVYGGLAVWNMVLAGVSLTSSLRVVLHYALYSVPALAILLLLKVWFTTSTWMVVVAATVSILVYYFLILYNDRVLFRYLTSFLDKS
jgi:O-antigen/teichoic acid export membrane protein